MYRVYRRTMRYIYPVPCINSTEVFGIIPSRDTAGYPEVYTAIDIPSSRI